MRFLPPISRRSTAGISSGPSLSGGGGDGGGGGGGAETKPAQRRVSYGLAESDNIESEYDTPLTRFEVTFDTQTLGIGLSAVDDLTELPTISHAPQGMKQPGIGDALESINGVSLAGEEDTYERAVRLITSYGRPITLQFISAPKRVTTLRYGEGKLGIALADREGGVPTVEQNHSG